jgi:hypothetical protein
MKLLSSLLCGATLLTSCLFSEETKEYLLNEMTHQDFIEIFDKHAPSTIIKIEEGTKLPISITSNSSVFSIELSEDCYSSFVINKPLYVKVQNSPTSEDCSLCSGDSSGAFETTMLFSQDQQSWKPFEELFTGNIFTGITTDEQHLYPTAKISVDLEFRG